MILSSQISRTHFLYRLFTLKKEERRPVVWSYIYFFSLLSAYYILRPLRDEMGIAGGIDNLPWVFTGTFVTILLVLPLYGWISAHYPRRQFLPWIYGFFILSLFFFYLWFESGLAHQYSARAFFIWVSVFNLYIVSVFWSFMADLYRREQARRLFGLIAGGGSLGAFSGPLITALFVQIIGMNTLVLISIAFLCLSIIAIHQLGQWQNNQTPSSRQIIGGQWYRGVTLFARSPYLLGIGVVIFLYTLTSTVLYFQQATIIRDYFTDPAQRTAVFAWIDFSVNALTFFLQLFLTARIVKRIGVAWGLAIVPLFLAAGLIVLGIAPIFVVLSVIQVVRRAGNYALMKPVREMLYVILPAEEKYKAKNFIDTAIYRGGDAISAWFYDMLVSMGLSLSHIAWITAPIACLWAGAGLWLGGQYQKRCADEKNRPTKA